LALKVGLFIFYFLHPSHRLEWCGRPYLANTARMFVENEALSTPCAADWSGPPKKNDRFDFIAVTVATTFCYGESWLPGRKAVTQV
jgi:hypothetical protein